ncbi:MAG: integrase core domain-containing protein [Candidatus Nanopelagicales bacterium]
MGLTAGPVPPRVDAEVKAGLLDLVGYATARGWTSRRAARLLGVDPERVRRWRHRQRAGSLEDRRRGGGAVHTILSAERAAILALYDVWGEVDKSHRKLAHRGSRENLVHVSESTVLRVLAEEHLILPGKPAREPRQRADWPDWVAWKPNSIWIYDFTHFTACDRVAVAVMDVVSRKWLTTLVSAEETSLQVEVAFLDALHVAGLEHLIDLDTLDALRNGHIGLSDLDDQTPVLLAVSDNGPQMRSMSTRQFMAAFAIGQQFGRPSTPTDQAWIESLFGHVKGEWPHLETIRDPAQLITDLQQVQTEYNTVRLHASLGYVTPDDEHYGRADALRGARQLGLQQARQQRIDYRRSKKVQQQ